MQIVKLEAENVKRLKAVRIEPNGSPMVVIGGKNGNGKTSLIDSIEMLLGGAGAIPAKPVREGSASARIVATFDDDIVIERRIAADGKTSLECRSKNGAKFPKPQSLVDSFCAKFTFDPLRFKDMKPADQVELLKSVTGLDFAELDRSRAAAYDNRTLANRDIKALEGQLSGLPEFPDAPETEVSVTALADEMNTASARNAIKERLKVDWDRAANAASGWRAEVEKAERTLAELRAKVVEADELLEAAAKAFQDAPGGGDLTPIRQRMAEAEEINRKIRSNSDRLKVAAALEDKRNESAALTNRIEAIDLEKRRLLAAAAFPVPGLSIEGEAVTVDGIPFEQLSAALQLRVSVAMGLALNPKLRILLIRDGSLLDEDNLRMVAEMAAEAEAQVWIERVGDGAEVSFVLEDGSIKADRRGEGA